MAERRGGRVKREELCRVRKPRLTGVWRWEGFRSKHALQLYVYSLFGGGCSRDPGSGNTPAEEQIDAMLVDQRLEGPAIFGSVIARTARPAAAGAECLSELVVALRCLTWRNALSRSQNCV